MSKSMIRLINVDSKYIRYLYNFDNHVMYNKGQKRPYIGILFEVKGCKYYAPLTSPKEKFTTMKNDVDFMRIGGGKYGAINFNNMIPVVDSAINIIDVKSIEDFKYKLILINQIKFFDDKELDILNKATKLYKAYKTNVLRPTVKNRCCNFMFLEKKAKFYNPNFKYDPKSKKRQPK